MTSISESSSSSGVQVRTSADMIEPASSSKAAGPDPSTRRTTSRSDTTPSTLVPSDETTSAPTSLVVEDGQHLGHRGVGMHGGDEAALVRSMVLIFIEPPEPEPHRRCGHWPARLRAPTGP